MSLHVERTAEAAVLIIDRPGAKNAIDRRLVQAIAGAVASLSQEPSVRGIVLTASGDEVFMSGGDLKELSQYVGHPDGGREVVAMGQGMEALEHCDVPVIAAVTGHVFGGGCELLLLCDYVIMEEHAHVSFRQARMGLSTAWGGMTRLLELCGPQQTVRLLFTGESVSADEALRMGMVGQVVPKHTSRGAALDLISRIAKNDRDTISAVKRTLRGVREARRADAVSREQTTFISRWGGPAHQAAMASFTKRKGSV